MSLFERFDLIYMSKKRLSPTSLKLFTFCFYIGKNTYQELVRMLYVLLASLDKFHPDFFLVVYHNLGITIDDPRVRMVRGFRPPATDSVIDSRDQTNDSVSGGLGGGGGGGWEVKDGDAERLLLEAPGCDGNVWIEGSAVRNRWHKLSFNKIHVFKNLYDEYGGVCFTWIDLDTIVLADMSYLNGVDNYFVMHGGAVSDRMHDVLVYDGVGGGGAGGGGAGGAGRVIWSIPERTYIQGSFWKLNLSLYHEVLRLDSMFREIGVRGKYDLQSLFAVMAWGGGLCPYYDGVSRAVTNSMLIIGENFMPGVMNGLGVWDTKNGVGNHVNTESLGNFRWGGANDGGGGGGMGIFRTSMYPDKEIHILSLTFDSFFMSNVSVASDFARLFPFLLV